MDVNEKLIEEVKKHEFLYNLASSSYKNVYIKAQIWETIADSLNLTSESCKKRWKGLRDTYKRRKRISQLASGSGAPSPVKKWKYSEGLSFLDGCKNSRATVGNVVLDEDTEFDFLLDCSSSTSISDGMTTHNTDESEIKKDNALPKQRTKKQADAEVTAVFTKMMKECVGTVKELASVSNSNEKDRDATLIFFESMARKICDTNLPEQDVRQIEAKVMTLVYEELGKASNK